MGVGQNVGSCIGLTQQVDWYFSLWKESVTQWWRKILCCTGKATQEVSLKITDWHLYCIPAVGAWWHHFYLNFYSSCIIIFRASDTSLYNIYFLGIIPARLSISIIVWYARVSSASLRFLMGLISIALLSISTITMMYLFPCCERVGNCPVWLEKTVFLTLYTLVYTPCNLRPRSVALLGTSRGVHLDLADLKSFLDWFRCPFEISMVSG